MNLNVFFAHPKAMSNADIDDACRLIRDRFRTRVPDAAVTVTPGRDDFLRAFDACGRSWDHWRARWSTGTDLEGKPYYDAIVVPGGSGAPMAAFVGKPTGQGIAAALAAGKPVVIWRAETNTYAAAATSELQDPRDFQHGWRVAERYVPAASAETGPLPYDSDDLPF